MLAGLSDPAETSRLFRVDGHESRVRGPRGNGVWALDPDDPDLEALADEDLSSGHNHALGTLLGRVLRETRMGRILVMGPSTNVVVAHLAPLCRDYARTDYGGLAGAACRVADHCCGCIGFTGSFGA